jgi:hypothetical protein
MTMREPCIACANGNDLPDGEYCRACGREGRAVGLGAAVIRARGRQEPPAVPVVLVDRRDERRVFEQAWAKRPWHRDELSDKELAWHWWQEARRSVGEQARSEP